MAVYPKEIKIFKSTQTKLKKMTEKRITLVQKQGMGSSGEQNLTYIGENYVVSQDSFIHLTETKIGGITFDPKSLREVIISIDTASVEIRSKQTDFTLVDVEEKNSINGLSQDFYDNFIAKEIEPYFNELDEFLSSRENEDLQLKISNIINTLNQKIYILRDKYDSFEKLLLDIQVTLLDTQYNHLKDKVNTVQFVIYYLYASCFIGLKTKNEKQK